MCPPHLDISMSSKLRNNERTALRASQYSIYTASDVERAEWENYTKCYFPFMVLGLSLLQIVFFVIENFTLESHKVNNFGPLARLLIVDPNHRQETWRIFTCVLIHLNLIHLMANILVQVFIGAALEVVHGSCRTFVLYIAGSAAGSLGASIFLPNSFLCGASAGVSALIAGHFINLILNWNEIKFNTYQLALVATLTVIQLEVELTNADNSVSHSSHLFGAIGGLLVGFAVLKSLQPVSWEERFRYLFAIVFAVCMITGMYFLLK